MRLQFGDGALEAIAEEAIKRNTGARGLRSIMEQMMMQIMYEVPSRMDVEAVLITGDCVRNKEKPEYVLYSGQLDSGEESGASLLKEAE